MRITPEQAQQTIDKVGRELNYPVFRTQNRPIINVLASFASFYNSAHSPEWLVRLESFPDPKSAFDKDDYLSLVVLSVFQGFETVTKFQIWLCAGILNRPGIANAAKKHRRGKTAVQHLFNDIPNAIQSDLGLDRADPEVGAFFHEFYKTVRNPLSHGDQLAGVDAYNFLSLLEWYRKGYEWLGGWGVPGSGYLELDGKNLRVRERPHRVNKAPTPNS